MGGISIVDGDEVARDEGGRMGRGDEEGKSDLLGDGVCSENQRVVCSVGRQRWEVQSDVMTLEGRVVGDESKRRGW